MLKRWIILIYLLLYAVVPTYASANFDVLKEVDAVTSSADNVYTLYVGMPKEDFVKNFSSLPGWNPINYDVYILGEKARDLCEVSRNINDTANVKEKIRTYYERNKVYFYTFSFQTNDKFLADQIYERAVSNLSAYLGDGKSWLPEQTPNEIKTKFKKRKKSVGGMVPERELSWYPIKGKNNNRISANLLWVKEGDQLYSYCIKIVRCSYADPCFACLYEFL